MLLAALLLASSLPAVATSDYVTDQAGVLWPSTRQWLQSELAAYRQATGHQVYVWLGQRAGQAPPEQWAGDDSAVLEVFVADSKVQIVAGPALRGSLSEAQSERIIDDEILPKIRAGHLNGAITYGVAAMLQTITPGFANVAPPKPTPQVAALRAFTYVVFAFFGIALILGVATRAVAR
ncbi:MAG TPA: TPM domain-containing protein [Candidatus Cybelea sp.]|jgi:uncharacterized protein|nr:TPM domain-containing protein [Candidatus Cybelea sp.]